jgi:heme oxygenase (mycobilin-producing)
LIVVENHIPVKPEFAERFEKMFSGGTRFVQNSKGFVRNEVLRPIKGEYYIVRTYWDSSEDFEHWTKSEDFAKAHSNARSSEEMFSGKSFLTIHQVVSSTEKKESSGLR